MRFEFEINFVSSTNMSFRLLIFVILSISDILVQFYKTAIQLIPQIIGVSPFRPLLLRQKKTEHEEHFSKFRVVVMLEQKENIQLTACLC